MKPALHKLIVDWLKEKRGVWVCKRDVENFGRGVGAFGNTAVRRLQEICQSTHRNYCPNIEHEMRQGVMWYRFGGISENLPVGEQMTTRTPVYSENRKTFNLDPNFCCASRKFYGVCAKNCQKQDLKIKQLF